MLLIFVVAFAASLIGNAVIVRYASVNGMRMLDYDLRGVQKMHMLAVPRIGGVGIAFAAALACCFLSGTAALTPLPAALFACAAPALMAGLLEDVTKRVSPRARFLSVIAAALLGCLILGAVIRRVGLPIVDTALAVVPFAVVFTVVAVTGLTNALNIIDGVNGLSSVVGIFILASIACVAYHVGDAFVMWTALIMIGAIGGFAVWNYPAGLVFLGDGGAYFIGFVIAELLVLLEVHPAVSTWYAVLVSIYPTWETLFSMYRRKMVRGRPVSAPDCLHLHTLIYRRARRCGAHGCDRHKRLLSNSGTAPFLWLLTLLAVVPATLFWRNGVLMFVSICAFIALYVWLYASIVHFRTPRWLFVGRPSNTEAGRADRNAALARVHHSEHRGSENDVC
ncbi:hypothetical protein WS70_23535 [Burkholderia mayonis]|uniref:Glycosyl transferase n=1 Tax=Burkholderia mayonis TaxID=1385591 RepID=A0A1B4FQ38_9BURK|nr:glycosyltransferase [Burkholderia mayonis]AOJ05781.1 hypothetical protein WS70_23535 [Burkholderia mayonis]KVE41358.1 hypothetical protein WS70_14760 [Burkholderia mayonis]